MKSEQLIKDYISDFNSELKYIRHSEHIDGQGFAYIDVCVQHSNIDEILHVYIEQLDLIAFVYGKINNK
jgi:hypothetical protein